MFIEQHVKIKSTSLDTLSEIIIAFKEACVEWESNGEGNVAIVKSNHKKLTAEMHLTKEKKDDTTT